MNREIYAAIDANINRGIEGIRVCEDIFRFSVKNAVSSEFKNLRHKIAGLVSAIPDRELLNGRDVPKDEQKFVNTISEMKRENIKDIFRSNIRRAVEASRVVEEFSKSIDTDIAAGFQEIRFSLYDLEKRGWFLLEKNLLLGRFRFSLYAIIDSAFVETSRMEETAKILSGSGADIIQLRMKNASDRDYLTASEKISKVCRSNGTLFIVNDRADVALLSGADGLHIGQDDIPLSKAKSLTGDRIITGVSVCSMSEASAAADADYIAVGPVFSTSSKDGSMLEGIGIETVREICRSTEKPVAAIGGISEANIGMLIEAGVTSFSMISALYRDGRISENTKTLQDIIKGYSKVK